MGSNSRMLVKELLDGPIQVPDYFNFLSRAGKRITDNKLRTLYKKDISTFKDIIMLSNGMPSPEPLPVGTIQFTLRDGTIHTFDKAEMVQVQHYGLTEGLTELREWLLELHRQELKPPQLTREDHPEPFQLTITNGIQDGVRNCFHILLDEGDPILVEREIFSNIVTVAQLFDANLVTVESNQNGMVAMDLERILESWSEKHPNSTRPRLLYTTTVCSNPTGYTWTEESVAEVYQVCRKYDVIILEDAAYHYLQFGERHLGFQPIDVDGRVIRLDTFSKTIGAGYRVGWISGPASLVSRYVLSMSQNTCHPCVPAQIIINKILQSWGHDKFNQQMIKVANVYRRKAEFMASVVEKYLKDLATWSFPRGGMFMWLRINGFEDTSKLMLEAASAGVSVVSGYYFTANFKPSSHIRLSFSVADDKDVEEGIKILANVIRKEREKIVNLKK